MAEAITDLQQNLKMLGKASEDNKGQLVEKYKAQIKSGLKRAKLDLRSFDWNISQQEASEQKRSRAVSGGRMLACAALN